jgi:hypothetical protein
MTIITRTAMFDGFSNTEIKLKTGNFLKVPGGENNS